MTAFNLINRSEHIRYENVTDTMAALNMYVCEYTQTNAGTDPGIS